MSQYMSEEQQIERIKKYWNNYGNIFLNAILFLAIAIAGWQWWQKHELGVQAQASTVYQQLMEGLVTNDVTAVQAHGNLILKEFPSSSYAHFTHLVFAKLAVEKNKYKDAITHLSVVRKEGSSKAIRQIARLREARVQLALQQYQQALDLLDKTDDLNFEAFVNQIKGDVYSAQGKKNKARKFYQVALDKMPSETPSHTFLEMKINNIPTSDKHVAQTTLLESKA